MSETLTFVSNHAANPITLVMDPQKDARESDRWRKGQYPSTEDTCFCCGRKATSHFVAIDMRTTKAVSVAYAMDDEDNTAFFPMGTTCRRTMNIPTSHVITRKALFNS